MHDWNSQRMNSIFGANSAKSNKKLEPYLNQSSQCFKLSPGHQSFFDVFPQRNSIQMSSFSTQYSNAYWNEDKYEDFKHFPLSPLLSVPSKCQNSSYGLRYSQGEHRNLQYFQHENTDPSRRILEPNERINYDYQYHDSCSESSFGKPAEYVEDIDHPQMFLPFEDQSPKSPQYSNPEYFGYENDYYQSFECVPYNHRDQKYYSEYQPLYSNHENSKNRLVSEVSQEQCEVPSKNYLSYSFKTPESEYFEEGNFNEDVQRQHENKGEEFFRNHSTSTTFQYNSKRFETDEKFSSKKTRHQILPKHQQFYNDFEVDPLSSQKSSFSDYKISNNNIFVDHGIKERSPFSSSLSASTDSGISDISYEKNQNYPSTDFCNEGQKVLPELSSSSSHPASFDKQNDFECDNQFNDRKTFDKKLILKYSSSIRGGFSTTVSGHLNESSFSSKIFHDEKQKNGFNVVNEGIFSSNSIAEHLIPLIDNLKADKKNISFSPTEPICLIISSTRENNHQIYEETKKLAKDSGITVACCSGQYNSTKNLADLRNGCNILCACIGRLLTFVENGQLSLENIRYLVINETDKFFQSKYENVLFKLLNYPLLPSKENRCTFLFDATHENPVIKKFVDEHIDQKKQETSELKCSNLISTSDYHGSSST